MTYKPLSKINFTDQIHYQVLSTGQQVFSPIESNRSGEESIFSFIAMLMISTLLSALVLSRSMIKQISNC